MRNKKGFTLIEMVAVVAIIGILAAILVPKVSGYIKEARKVQVIDQARKVVQAFEGAEMKGSITKLENSDYSVSLKTPIDEINNKTMLSLLDIDSYEPTIWADLVELLDKLYLEPNPEDGKRIATIDECFDIVAGGEFNINSEGILIGEVEDVITK